MKNKENPDLQEEEEPTLDAETLKALKNCSIDDEIAKADFSQKDKKNKNAKKAKKANTKKGQDFLDFAQEKGIELKIQYEDNKDESKKGYHQKENNLQYKGGKFHEKSDYSNNKDGNANPNYKKNFYNKNFNKYANKNFHFQNKSKNNKFDQVNNMMYNPMMFGEMRQNVMNPYQMNPYNQNQQNFHQPQQEMDPFFVGERSVEEIISYVFSPEFLNKEVYIRNRICADGLMDLNHFLNYNK